MSPPLSGACRVLVVEDDVAPARLLAQMLREDGFEVSVALDGAAAIARLASGPAPDVLVTDYRLPHADGLAVAAFARSLHPATQVVLVTSYPEVLARIGRALDPPAMVLSKPLAYGDLVRALEPARRAREAALPEVANLK